ncbi:MarR family transcriptional regulator [Halolamina sp.]|jgi:predicted transcriptional regulator|uniref:winged helix-turn-helix transcriptional regulator n=1 Tax=Halolamina sp. TaxID=1940283 RepID=UPI000223BEA6|nr:regulatory protein ArsR [halophilic archaeon DL31]
MTTRERLLAHVETHPGVHVNALGRELDLATGQVQYHLKRLRDGGAVVADQQYGRTHYFPPGYTDRERRTLALARRETVRELLLLLIECEESTAGDLTDELGIARSTLSYHADRLVEAELLEQRRGDHGRVRYALVEPTETLRLLEAIRPSLPDRLLDRFTRLVDDLLAG